MNESWNHFSLISQNTKCRRYVSTKLPQCTQKEQKKSAEPDLPRETNSQILPICLEMGTAVRSIIVWIATKPGAGGRDNREAHGCPYFPHPTLPAICHPPKADYDGRRISWDMLIAYSYCSMAETFLRPSFWRTHALYNSSVLSPPHHSWLLWHTWLLLELMSLPWSLKANLN